MRKLEKLIEAGAASGSPDFEALVEAFLKQKKTVENGLELERKKGEAIEKAASKNASAEILFALVCEAEKERLRQKIRCVDLSLAKFLLKNWLRAEGRSFKKVVKTAQKGTEQKPKKAAKTDVKKPEKPLEKSNL